MKPPRIFLNSVDISNQTIHFNQLGKQRYLPAYCKSENDIQWSVNQRVITTKAKLIIFKKGLYLCKATDTDLHYSRLSWIKVVAPRLSKKVPKTTVPTSTTLEQAKKPRVVGKVDVRLGETLELACVTDMVDSSLIVWIKDGQEMEEIGNIYKIPSAKYQDSGEYYCIANTTNSNSSDPVNIRIGTPPTVYFDVKSELLVFYPDTPAYNLSCITKSESEVLEQYLVVPDGGKLDKFHHSWAKVNPPSEFDQTYDVLCVAANIFGKAEARIKIMKQNYFLNNLTINVPDEIELVSGDSNILSCKADGYPSPQIHWTRKVEGESFSLSSRVQQWANGTLAISGIVLIFSIFSNFKI